jgi:hypothetical protein
VERDEHHVYDAAYFEGEGGMMFGGALVLAAGLSQAAPAPAAQPSQPGQITVLQEPAGSMVRVHFSTPRNSLEAKLWARRGSDSNYTLVCAAPCKADVPAGTPLRATITDHEDEPYDFILSNDMGREVDIVARRGGRGALAGGIVMTSIGGLVMIIGIALTAISFADSTLIDESAFRTAGLICLGLGGGLTVGGVVLISGRSYEPVVKQDSWETRRGAVETRSWASVPLPSATTPFSLSVTF